MDEYVFICGHVSIDYDYVTKGLNAFSLDFLKTHADKFNFKKNDEKNPNGPYTNLFGILLNKVRNNDIFEAYRNEIDSSDMIYKRRWGDLPLWGEVIYYIFGDESLNTNNSIKYFHGSHRYQVN